MSNTLYSAGWNMTGCLAESEPALFGSFDDAKQYIIDTMLEFADQAGDMDDEEGAETLTNAAEDVNLESGEFSVYAPANLGHYWYWVAAYAPETKEEALAAHLECSPDDIVPESYEFFGATIYSAESGEYLVLTDEEADECCAEYIKESAWAFNADFLAGMTGIPAEMFTAAQDKCEGANDAFVAIINGSCGMDDFVEAAISADGRGHLLSSYDGNEEEIGNWFIYRVN